MLLCSAAENRGIAEVLSALDKLCVKLEEQGHTALRRHQQDRWWMRATIEERLVSGFFADPRVQAALPELERAVTDGSRSPFDAADELLRFSRD